MSLLIATGHGNNEAYHKWNGRINMMVWKRRITFQLLGGREQRNGAIQCGSFYTYVVYEQS